MLSFVRFTLLLAGTNTNSLCREIGMRNHRELPYNHWLVLKKPREGIIHILKVTKEEFGFDGFFGLCAGNKLLETIGIEAAKAQPAEQTNIDFLTFMQQATGDR
jgi:hypothetical protein